MKTDTVSIWPQAFEPIRADIFGRERWRLPKSLSWVFFLQTYTVKSKDVVAPSEPGVIYMLLAELIRSAGAMKSVSVANYLIIVFVPSFYLLFDERVINDGINAQT